MTDTVGTSVQFGADKTGHPWVVGVYDSANVRQPIFYLPATGGGAFIAPSNGGTGLLSPTGYVYFNGAGAATASTTIPVANVTGLAPIATSGSASDLTTGTMPVARMPALIGGDATTIAGSGTITFNTVNANVGAFGSSTAIPTITVNGKGLITAVSTNAVIAPAGTLTGTTLAANVVNSSLTSVGTIATGTWQGTAIASAYLNHNGSETFSGAVAFNSSATFANAPVLTALTGYVYANGAGVVTASTTVPAANLSGTTLPASIVNSSLTTLGAGAAATNLAASAGSTRGGIYSYGAAGISQITPSSTIGYVLTSNGTGADPTFQVAPTAVVLRGFIGGLQMSNDGTSPNTVLDISAGQASSDDATTLMSLASNFTKTTSAWAVGTGNGALDTGSIAANTWYHVFVIERTDTFNVDILFSTSPSSPTLPTNYTKKRRIGSFKTDGSSNILAFSQNGDEFLWSVSKADVSVTNLAGSATLYTLTVPTGVVVNARFRFVGGSSSGSAFILITSPAESSQTSDTPVGNAQIVTNAANAYQAGESNTRVNTSAQIRAVSTVANSILQIATFGWIDSRGKYN